MHRTVTSCALLVLGSGLLAGTPRVAGAVSVQSGASRQVSCPKSPDSPFCRWVEEYESLERARTRIVEAAREAGMEDPSGLIVLLRDERGRLTIRKVDLELPASVEEKLNGYLTPLVVEHMAESSSSLILELDPVDVPHRPHPDSASRPPAVQNFQELRRQLDQMAEHLKEAPGEETGHVMERDSLRIVYEALVDSSGRVRHVTVRESSGAGLVDEYFAQLIIRLEVAPKVSFGVPNAARLVQPVTLFVRERAGSARSETPGRAGVTWKG